MESKTTFQGSPVTETLVTVGSSAMRKDLPGLIRNMKQSHTWAKGDLNAMVLIKDPERNVMLVALHEGTEIVSYQSNDSITFQIIEGKMEFNTRKTSAAIGMGQVLTLNDKVKYRLTASEETVMLLSISKDAARNASGRSHRKEARVNY